MSTRSSVKIVGYDKGIPVTRFITRCGGTFVKLYSTDLIYSRAIYRGGGARGSREEEEQFIASLDPIREDGNWWLSISHQVTSAIGASLDQFREALAQVDDDRAPRLEGDKLDTLPQPSLWCDEWGRLWDRAMSSAKLILFEQLKADVPAEVRRAVSREDWQGILRPYPTVDVTMTLPSNVSFAMGLQPGGESIYRLDLPATDMSVRRKGLPEDRFISGMLEMRTRILASDCYARDLLAAATGRLKNTSVLLEAEEGDMVAAMLAVRASNRRTRRAAARLKEFASPWGEYAAGLQ